jgi:hypothetical protein
MLRQVALSACFLAVASGAMAADEPVGVADVIVQAPQSGPALWRVTRGDAEAWIIALPDTPVPQDLFWRTAELQSRLTGAKALLLPAQRSGVTANSQRPPRVFAMPTSLPPSLRERFVAAVRRINVRPERYNSRFPVLQPWKLRNDYFTANRFDGNVVRQIEAMARSSDVPVRRAAFQGDHNRSLLVWPTPFKTPEVNACYTAVFDEIEAPLAWYRAAARAWASGDVLGAMIAPNEFKAACDVRMLQRDDERQAVDQQTDAIVKALASPGKVVVAAPMESLLTADGILARLRASGFEVADPKGVDSRNPAA